MDVRGGPGRPGRGGRSLRPLPAGTALPNALSPRVGPMPSRILPGAEAFRFDGGPIGVLLQHGFTGSPASMRPFGEWLAARGVSVIGPRLPGHGTSWEDLEGTTWHDWENEAEGAIRDLKARCSTVIAVGLSMGGAMVLHLGAKHPDKLSGIVTVNADLRRPELALAPVVRLLMRTTK